MKAPQLQAEAIAAITEAAGSAPAMEEFVMECIDLLSEDMRRVHCKATEKVSESLYVVRDMEEDGQKFDYWMFCKHGSKHAGQTMTAVVLK